MSAAVAPERSSTREVSRIMLAPKTIEKRHRILPSIRMRNSAQLARFKPVAPPATVGSLPAAKYMPKTRTFAGRIPSSANPRSVSNELMRSFGVIGPIGVIRFSSYGVQGMLRRRISGSNVNMQISWRLPRPGPLVGRDVRVAMGAANFGGRAPAWGGRHDTLG